MTPSINSSNDGLPRIRYFGHLHPSHESMISDPPKGFSFRSNIDPSIYQENELAPSYSPSRRLLARIGNGLFRAVHLPRMMPLRADCDLLHVDGCILPITSAPWIIGSIEYSGAFFSFDDRWYGRSLSRRALTNALSNRRCKKILALSEASLGSLELALGSDFEKLRHKSDVLYPAVPPRYLMDSTKPRDDHGTVRILFVGSHFFDKGGRETYYAFKRLKKRYDVALTIVASAPTHHQSYFEEFKKKMGKEDGLQIYSNLPRSVLWKECFLKSDIFCFPSYMETFGYVVLEAMAARSAVVASDEFAIPEMVRSGVNGITVHAPHASFERGKLRSPDSLCTYRNAVLDERKFESVVDSLETSLASLIEDSGMRRRFTNEGFREVSEGRFSVIARNEKLSRIYKDALE